MPTVQKKTLIYDESKRAKLFVAFQYLYGQLWTNKLDITERDLNAIYRVWDIALSDITTYQVNEAKNAIMKGLTAFSKYPPSPAEFAELAKSIVDREKNTIEASEKLQLEAELEGLRLKFKKIYLDISNGYTKLSEAYSDIRELSAKMSAIEVKLQSSG